MENVVKLTCLRNVMNYRNNANKGYWKYYKENTVLF